ncbi:helix-turn-helix domain-containing protein, partial [Escherichia coli]|uniref:helix-turn-helix domain-containing protein n=1 Tax=Escherichia coli TaxID=562 RepID=UPI002076E7DC
MSMELMVKAMKIRVGNPLRKLVLIKLADNASDQGECWPSYQHIADQCEISKRSVMNHIAALCESGLVKKVTRKGEKGNSSNIYLLHLDGAGDSLGGIAPPDIPAGFVAVFNSDEASWHLVEDHRGKTVYDVASGDALFISELGPLPENVTWLSPGGEY